MRAFPLAWRGRLLAGLAIAVVLAIATTTSARADKPTVSELQVQLVESRQQLNDLYARSAAASERLNGAKYELEMAKKAVTRHRAEVASARKKLQAQEVVVAAMTVEQLQSGSSVSRLSAMFSSSGPQQLLERASAYASTNEATVARIATLTARRVVLDAAAREAQDALDAQNKATAEHRAAKAEIEQAIAKAEGAASTAARERHRLLVQLAEASGTTVDEVTEAQDQIDEQLDESGPSTPPRPGPDPTPTPTPTRTTPPPPPPPNPPPPSSSKVEKAIAFAKAQLGEPYKWGAAGPSSWDCSGLTMRAWGAAGVSLSHYAGAQYTSTKAVPVSKIVRGDLLYWSDGGAKSIYHVAMYLGGGQMIHAPRPGRNVEIVSINYWIKPDLASRPG
ncbi:C40 family peptidase [Aeromicrobium sp.]|uniref:C40 family peptidase n=1 Tax=Aeromicrobium sp. TaxID=1871063 RepID=UPI002FCAC91C